MNINIYISRQSNMMGIINQNYLTGQMTALAFIHLKMHFAKIKETDLSKRLGQIFIIRPRNNDTFRVDRFVRREYLTDIYIRLVKWIFSRYPSLPKNSFFKQNAVLALANFRKLYHSFQRKSIKYRNSYHCSSF